MRGLILGLLLLLTGACTSSEGPEAPGQVVAERATAALAGLAAPGDTLRYTLSWTAGARATGYLVTTTVTQGTGWSGLLTSAPTGGLSMAFTPINPTAWDSVSFSACVASTNNGKTSSPRCTSWTLARSPGQPGPVVVDSSLVIAAVILKPDAVTMATAGIQQFCPFARSLDGGVRFFSGYETLSECQGHYDAMPDRLPGYPVQLAVATHHVRLGGAWSVAVRTARDELAHLLFVGPFQEAVWSS